MLWKQLNYIAGHTLLIVAGLLIVTVLYYMFLKYSRFLSREGTKPWQAALFAGAGLGLGVMAAVAAEVGGGPVAVILSTMLGALIPGFFIFLRHHLNKIYGAIDKVTSISTSLEVDKSLSEDLKRIVNPAFRFLSQRAVSLNSIIEKDARGAEVLLGMMSRKMVSAVSQAIDGEVYIREEQFKPVWQQLTAQSESYLSLCDLTVYSRVGEPSLSADRAEWERRVGEEVAHLAKIPELTRFDKVILYETRVVNGKASKATEPPCAKVNGACDPFGCEIECLVKDVFRSWSNGITRLSGKSSHLPTGNRMIWLARKRDFRVLESINTQYYSEPLRSSDLGIFGHGLLGEEFKLQRELAYSASLTTGKSKELSNLETFDYLYIISKQEGKSIDLRNLIIDKLQRGAAVAWA